MNSSGEMLKMSAPLEHLNLHIREGSILPTQVSGPPITFLGSFHSVYASPSTSTPGTPSPVVMALQNPCL